MAQLPKVGERFITVQEIERFDDYLATKGISGTIIASDEDVIAMVTDIAFETGRHDRGGNSILANTLQWAQMAFDEDLAIVFAQDCAPYNTSYEGVLGTLKTLYPEKYVITLDMIHSENIIGLLYQYSKQHHKNYSIYTVYRLLRTSPEKPSGLSYDVNTIIEYDPTLMIEGTIIYVATAKELPPEMAKDFQLQFFSRP